MHVEKKINKSIEEVVIMIHMVSAELNKTIQP
jgi:hypothetical protein